MPASPPLLHLGYSSVLQKAPAGPSYAPGHRWGQGKGRPGPARPGPRWEQFPQEAPTPHPTHRRLCHLGRAQDLGEVRLLGTVFKPSAHSQRLAAAACSGAVSPPLNVTPGRSVRRELHTANRQGMEESRGPGLGERGREAPPQLQPTRLTLPPGARGGSEPG